MLRVVLDTNVILDCWVFADPAAAALRAALETRRAVALRSSATDLELRDVLARPVFAARSFDPQRLFERWCHAAELIDPVPPGPARLRCTDPDDQKFLDLALAAGAQALFTKDKALLATAGSARDFGLAVLPLTASVRFFQDHAA